MITHNDTHSIGLPCTCDRLVAEASTSINTQHSQETNIRASGGIRTRILSKRVATVLRLGLLGHGDRKTGIFTATY